MAVRPALARRALATAGVAAAVLGGTVSTSTAAGAAAAPRLDPATAVSSSGTFHRTLELAGGASTSAPSRGTGRLADARGVDLREVVGSNAKPLGAESILGRDDRVREWTTTNYPARATVRITSSIGQCTGWLIGPDTVATAGHCVHSAQSGWATGVTVVPGQNGVSRPYGSCGARQVHSVVGWVSSKNHEYDYGAIKLNCTIGNTVGWYGYRWTTASLNGAAVTVRGYPGDKPATQWFSRGTVLNSQVRKLYYTNDTVGGMSGSAVYDYVNGVGPYGVAVHAYGTGDGITNSGTRITSGVASNFAHWKSL